VRHAAVEFEPADRGFVRGPGKIAQAPPAERTEGERQHRQHTGMNPGIEAGEKVEMGRGDEQGHESQQRHETRPEAFPGQRCPRQTDLAAQPGRLDLGGLAGVHRLPFN
jgi:hypothetical protein